ncbi:MAG TPA: LLM class flavin-dependent oxidoreductase [Candidatus Binataceae bacterium]|nr:LLM class flavin-dependent oxidoreductase [Candidatus Binataceae bacterium]
MPDAKKLGLHLSIGGSERFKFAKEAEDLGYSSLWVAEVSGPDALVTLGALAVSTSKAELATGVIPMQIRTPAVNAMAFLTVHELSGGRAIAGLGVSSPIIVERWHGASYKKPVTAMRECVTIMRQLFTEGKSKFEGEIYRCDIRLSMRPSKVPPKIFLAGLNAPMLRLAGEMADGVLMNYSPPEAMPAMIKEIEAGAKKAGRNPADIDVGIYIRMCITEDESKAIDQFRRELATYAFVDSYNKMFARYGLADEFNEVRRMWKEGKRDEAPFAISEASARKIAAFGPAKVGRDFVAKFRDAGVTHPVVFPIGPGATIARDAPTTMRALAGA